MLLRLLIALGIAAAAGLAWVLLRPHKLLRVPRTWRALARRDATVARALSLRQGMARLLVRGRATHASHLLANADGLVTSIVEMARIAEDLNALPPGARVEELRAHVQSGTADALASLERAHTHLVAAGLPDIRAARARLEERTEDLRVALDVSREVERHIRSDFQVDDTTATDDPTSDAERTPDKDPA